METRVCNSCKIEKPLTRFYKGESLHLGHQHKCKECSSKNNKQYYLQNRERLIIKKRQWDDIHPGYQAKWAKENRQKKRAASKRYKTNPINKDKVLARNAIYRAVKSGKIERPTFCKNCKKKKHTEAHHYKGYTERFCVIWLCRACHGKQHPRSPF